MKFFKVLLILMLAVTSCKSSKTTVGSSVTIKSITARKVSKKHLQNEFDKNTVEAKLKVAYQDKNNNQKLSVKLRIEKDKVIWLNATYIGIIVARVKITPSSVSYYEKLNKTYFKGNFELLKNILGADINFIQLQNLFLGQAIFDLNAQKYKEVVDNNAHLLMPVEQKALFDILFWINPIHFKLDKQELHHSLKNQTLKVAYTRYSKIDGEIFPKNIEIRATGNDTFTNIDIEFRSVIFDKVFLTPFKVPSGYKQVVF
tara:strand:+ start:2862 stop:3635 length:774 start_codon:yes stop_codon:yes gene_type:complete